MIQAGQEKAPNVVAMYLYELAQRFNTFYNGTKIAGDANRLWLTQATARVLASGLALLGISAPNEM